MFRIITSALLTGCSLSVSMSSFGSDRTETIDAARIDDLYRHLGALRWRVSEVEKGLRDHEPSTPLPLVTVTLQSPPPSEEDVVAVLEERLNEACEELDDGLGYLCDGDFESIESEIGELNERIGELDARHGGVSIDLGVCAGVDPIPGNWFNPCTSLGGGLWFQTNRHRFSSHGYVVAGNPLNVGGGGFVRLHWRQGDYFSHGVDIALQLRDYNVDRSVEYHQFRTFSAQIRYSLAYTLTNTENGGIDFIGYIGPSIGMLIKSPAVGSGSPVNWIDASVGIGFSWRIGLTD